MIWYYLRGVFAITIPTFYRKVQTRHVERVRVKNPVLLAMTHPNAFMDPIAFSLAVYSPRTYYMARGDAFKKGFVSWMLVSIGIVPIFRMRDAGIEGVKKNADSFKRVYSMWKARKKIMVFAEGLCVQERRLRPIQKGAARMAFGYCEEAGRDDLLIIPVSVNYSHPEKFRSFLFYDVGEAIPVKEYLATYKENSAKAVSMLTKEIEMRLKVLTPHVENKEDDALVEQLQFVYKRQWLEENLKSYFNLEHQQEFWFAIIAKVNAMHAVAPEVLDKLKALTNTYVSQLKKHKIRDFLVRNAVEGKSVSLASQLALLALGYPFYLTGKLLFYAPYALSKKLSDKLSKDVEFHSSINICVGSFLVQLFYGLEILGLWLFTHSWMALGIYTLIKIALGWFALHFSPVRKRIVGLWRWTRLQKKNPDLCTSWMETRKGIMGLLKEK